MIKTIMKIVRTRAVTTPMTRPTASFGAVSGAPVRASPPRTTLLQTSAITNPNAVPSDVAIVLRTSPIEIRRSSAIVNSPPEMDEGFKGLPFDPAALDLRDDMDTFDPSLRILSPPIFLERLHHVPYREQGDDNSIERLHLDARLVGRFDACRHGDPV